MNKVETVLSIIGIVFHVGAMAFAGVMVRGKAHRGPWVAVFVAMTVMLCFRVLALFEGNAPNLALYRSLAALLISALLLVSFFFIARLTQSEQQSKMIAQRRAVERDEALNLLNAAMLAGEAGTWVWDVPGDRMLLDENFARLFSIAAGETSMAKLEKYTDAIHSDDRAPAIQTLHQALNGRGADYQDEYRVRAAGDKWRWIISRGRIERDSDQKALRISAIVMDITERKETEQRNRMLAAVVENTSEFVGIWTPDLAPIFINDAARNMVGLNSLAEAMRTRILDYFALEDQERMEQEALVKLRREGQWSGEVRFRHFETGRIIHTIWNAFVIKDKTTGRPLAIASVSQNLSRMKDMEAALRVSDDQVQLATDAAALGTFDFNPVTGELKCSERTREFFGVAHGGEVDEKTFLEKLHGDDIERVFREVETSLDPEGTGEIDTEYRIIGLPNGASRWIRAKGRAFFDSIRAVRVVGTVQDISDNKRGEAERESLLQSERAARAAAEGASRLKDEFVATLSHELRTPLNAILGWAQILRNGGSNADDLKQGLEIIERNARAQTTLIEDLLDMSRIISGKLRLDVQSVDAIAVIKAAIETVRPAAQARGIVLQEMLDPAAGPISGDPHRLQQVVWNLLSNAIKFTPKQGRAKVLLQRVNSHVEIVVSDNGQGISAEFLPHVFERFQQADASTTRKYGGLGLGLAIVKHLVELHGGSVKAESGGENQGSTFTVALPLTAIHGRNDDSPRLHPKTSLEADVPGGLVQLAGLRILAVDDEPDARDLIRHILEKCGAKVETSSGGADALKTILSFRPDLLISDIGMPEIDGYEFLRLVRSSDAHGKIPAIALTAFARSEDRTRALRAGFLAHVAKPVEPAELIATVASVSGRT